MAASSWLRSRCGSYQRRISSNSAGHALVREQTVDIIATNAAQSSAARGGGANAASASAAGQVPLQAAT
jgi:hypothetical protein